MDTGKESGYEDSGNPERQGERTGQPEKEKERTQNDHSFFALPAMYSDLDWYRCGYGAGADEGAVITDIFA